MDGALYGKLWEPVVRYRFPIICCLLAICGHVLAIPCRMFLIQNIRKYDRLCVNVRQCALMISCCALRCANRALVAPWCALTVLRCALVCVNCPLLCFSVR